MHRRGPQKPGLVLHWAVGFSLVGAAIFVGDPVTAEPSQLTSHGMVHGICASIGIPAVPAAALAVVYGMTMRGTPDRRRLSIAAFAVVLGVVSMFIYIAVLMSGGAKIGPADYTGWANRIVVAAFDWWWISAAVFAIRLNRRQAAARVGSSVSQRQKWLASGNRNHRPSRTLDLLGVRIIAQCVYKFFNARGKRALHLLGHFPPTTPYP